MLKLAARRLVLMVAVLFAVTFLAFSAMNLIGDPLFNIVGVLADIDCSDVESGVVTDRTEALGGGTASTGTSVHDRLEEDCATVAEARQIIHLDRPFPVRYGLWLGDIVRGDFGRSFQNNQPVSEVVRDKLPETLILLVMAQTVALGVAIPWGVTAAYRANRAFDRGSTVASFGLLSVPNFAMGVVLLYLLALRWQIFPSSFESDDLPSLLFSLVLPAFTLGLPVAAIYQRLLRTDLITTLQEDYVHMARAKGLPGWWIMLRHALRPSLFSVVTVVGVNTGALIGGSLVVERIFGIPGIGSEIVIAVVRDDFPVVLAMVVVIAVAFVVINFVVDLIYTWLDPRVRVQ